MEGQAVGAVATVQVLELLDTHHWQQQQQQQSSLSASAATEQLLVLHQLTWQLEAMQALMLLLTAKQAAEQATGQLGTSGPEIQGVVRRRQTLA